MEIPGIMTPIYYYIHQLKALLTSFATGCAWDIRLGFAHVAID